MTKRKSGKLLRYQRKRDFKTTPEPHGRKGRKGQEPGFVIQEHHARRLHFDFRIEHEGVMKSWAVTRMPTMDPGVKALAIEVEDHPMEYASFEGTIPAGEYGAGTVSIWDSGTFEAIKPVNEGIESGELLVVVLRGRRLSGRFALIRIGGEGEKSRWLFFKMKPRVVGMKIPEAA